MPRVSFGVQATLLLPHEQRFGLGFDFSMGSGPTQILIGPDSDESPLKIGDMLAQVAAMLGIDALRAVANIQASEPWKTLFSVSVKPFLTVQFAKSPSVELVVELYEHHDGRYTPGITLPPADWPSWVTIEPSFTVYDLIVGYDPDAASGGLDLRARVQFADQPKATTLRASSDEAQPKTEIVSYPFPVPAGRSGGFQLHYLGLGQHFGPTVDVDAVDPMAAMFTTLETVFTTNNPATLLETLASCYDEERGWFVGADVEFRGWRVRAVFNDPSLYGLEITCSEGAFNGLLFEILYQKLGPGLGVYYGALTLPTQFRRIQVGVVTVILPSFRIWIYTNGDFKVSVGWPLGENSIGVEVLIFTGGCGFYFAKLRSGDNPERGGQALATRGCPAVNVTYNPVVEFGFAVWLGLGRSFQSGPFSASLSLTMQGTLQGVLAWVAPPEDHSKAATIAKPPDYWWFAATVGLVGQLQGEVDLKVVKLSVLVRLSVTAGLALETGYGTTVEVTAKVDVQASLKIVFVKITVGFHTTISQHFELTGGTPASIEGPRNPAFHGMNDWAVTGLDTLEDRLLALADPASAPAPRTPPRPPAVSEALVTVDLRVLVQPAAVYAAPDGTGGADGTAMGVVTLLIEAPAPPPTRDASASAGTATDGDPTPLERLLTGLAEWLLGAWSDGTGRWSRVLESIGQGRAPVPDGWDDALQAFLVDRCTFVLHPLDLSAGDTPEWHAALFPMFDALQVAWSGHPDPVAFADNARTHANYVHVVEEYFDTLSLSGLVANPEPRGIARFGPLGAATGGPPAGPSLVRFLFDDYFLTLARQLATTLAGSDDHGGMPDAAQATNLGGMTSRYLLHGLRLPDPATTPPAPPVDLHTLTVGSGYALAGQQLPVPADAARFAATLSLAPDPGPLASIIRFAADAAGDDPPTSVSSTMPVQPLPSAPSPAWRGPTEQAEAAAAAIDLAAIPPARPQAVWVTQRTRMPWQQEDAPARFAVPLPSDVLAAARSADVTLTVQTNPPDSPSPAARRVRPALMIPLTVHLVDRLRGRNVDVSDPDHPRPADPYLPFVYRVDGTDDETRTRIEALLDAGGADAAEIALLRDAPTTGYVSDPLDLARHPVLLAKTNLSTTTNPNDVTSVLRLATRDDGLGPASASVAEPTDFLRLLWEVSVVHAGGFYLRYQSADGDGLPDSIFGREGQVSPAPGVPAGDSAPLLALVVFPEGTTVSSWHDALIIDDLPADAGTIYLGLADTTGQALQVLQPSYPPGCVGFTADWTLEHLLARDEAPLYDEDWVTALYHLLQYRVTGASPDSPVAFGTSLWSLALGPTDKDEPEGVAEDAGPSDHYRQVVPVFRFVGQDGPGGLPPDPYAAVGGRPQLGFRLNDVFGNALDDDTHVAPFDVAYNDPLVTPTEWPGTSVAYRFLPVGTPCGPDSDDSARLCLRLRFDPDAVLPNAPPAAAFGLRGAAATDERAKIEQAQVVLFRYRTIAAQLADPRTTLTLRTTVLPSDGGVIGDGSALEQQLGAFVEQVVAQLSTVVEGGDAKAVTAAIAVPLDPSDLTDRVDDIFPVEVSLTLARPAALVYADADGAQVPKSASATALIPADLDPPPDGTPRARARAAETGGSPVSDVTLQGFGEDFEAVFAGFDCADGAARLLVRTDAAALGATSATPSLWAMRWSRTAGIHVSLPGAGAAYFSMTPLSVNLVGGTADVPSYDAALDATTSARTFSGIDLDSWARAFLDALERVLAPDVATTIAAADAVAYEHLMQAKAVVAQCLANGVEPVFTSPDEAGADVIPGDLAAAREQLEQTALARLSDTYGVASIVQTPADVLVAGTAEEGAAVPPRFFGALSPTVETAAAATSPAVTVTNAKLALRTSGDRDPNYLTFLVSVAEPQRVTHVAMDVGYRVRFIEHLIDAAHGYDEYVPSQWLRVALDQPHEPLNMKVGYVEAPVPSRAHPPLPVLRGQRATQSAVTSRARTPTGAAPTGAGPAPGGGPGEVTLRWDYSVNLDLPEVAAQDALWVDVTYNRALDGGLLASDEDPLTGLFEALASFTTAWEVLAAYVAALPGAAQPDPTGDGPTPEQVVAAVWAQVRLVAEAWGTLRGVRPPWSVGDVATRTAGADVPSVVTDHYVLDFAGIAEESLRVLAQAPVTGDGECDADAIVWPTIDGQTPGDIAPVCPDPTRDCAAAPTSEPCWYSATYRYTPPAVGPPAPLSLIWANLDLFARQTAVAQCHTVRNADLSSAGLSVNPRFVYRTPIVAFTAPVVPLLVVPPSGPLPPGTSLAATLEEALAPLATVGVRTSSTRLVQVEIGYAYPIGGRDDAAVTVPATTSVLFADHIELTSDDRVGAADGPTTLPQLAADLASDCDAWYTHAKPSTAGATMSLAVVLFAEAQGMRLPIVRFEDITVEVPASWWPSAGSR